MKKNLAKENLSIILLKYQLLNVEDRKFRQARNSFSKRKTAPR